MIQPEKIGKMMDELGIDRMTDEFGTFGASLRAISNFPWLWASSRIRGTPGVRRPQQAEVMPDTAGLFAGAGENLR